MPNPQEIRSTGRVVVAVQSANKQVVAVRSATKIEDATPTFSWLSSAVVRDGDTRNVSLIITKPNHDAQSASRVVDCRPSEDGY